jgi:hypothetical protein
VEQKIDGRAGEKIETKLILIEGLPGSGKSTTTHYLQAVLQSNGYACQQYLEEDEPHPINCLEFEVAGLTEKVVPLWARLVEKALHDPDITIIESRLWQNTAMYMHMGDRPLGEIIKLNQQVGQVVGPLAPVLFYLDQDDTEEALRRLYTLRGNEWVNWALEATTSYQWFQSHGMKDFDAWVRFFKEWRGIADQLFNEWPGRKAKIMNPHADWAGSYREMCKFLGTRDKRTRAAEP